MKRNDGALGSVPSRGKTNEQFESNRSRRHLLPATIGNDEYESDRSRSQQDQARRRRDRVWFRRIKCLESNLVLRGAAGKAEKLWQGWAGIRAIEAGQPALGSENATGVRRIKLRGVSRHHFVVGLEVAPTQRQVVCGIIVVEDFPDAHLHGRSVV